MGQPVNEPDTIGHYRITHMLGEGGMGVVYAAHDQRLDRAVAITRIRNTSADVLGERLLREARTAASINHPNACHVYELAEDDAGVYLVMELLTARPWRSGSPGGDWVRWSFARPLPASGSRPMSPT